MLVLSQNVYCATRINFGQRVFIVLIGCQGLGKQANILYRYRQSTPVDTPPPPLILGSHLYYNKNKRPPYLDPPQQNLHKNTFKCTLDFRVNVRYYVHMTKNTPVTITEFRRNTKVIMDGAKVAPVTLRRGDDLFTLVFERSLWEAPTVSVNGGDPIKALPGGVITYEGKSPPSVVVVPSVADLLNKGVPYELASQEAQKSVSMLSSEKPCCGKAHRCQHWQWDSSAVCYVNTLSGRVLEDE